MLRTLQILVTQQLAKLPRLQQEVLAEFFKSFTSLMKSWGGNGRAVLYAIKNQKMFEE